MVPTVRFDPLLHERLCADLPPRTNGPGGTIAAMRLTAAITQEGDWFVARCLEVEVTSQGKTLDDARTNLTEALELFFEGDSDVEVAGAPVITPIDVAV